MQVYLDNSATTRQYDQVTEYMVKLFQENYGNPSSLHRLGLEAEKILESSRKDLAQVIGAKSKEIFFTASGTEADNTALFGTGYKKRRQGKKIITTKVEHPAILEPAKRLEEMGYEVVYIDVDKNCNLNLEQLKNNIDENTILISVMSVNNETGALMPISEIGKLKSDFNKSQGRQILLHCDGVQALGKVNLNMSGEYKDVDLMSFSSHKIHGPKGVGMLYMRDGANISPYMLGGGQENHFRSGTENLPAIGGFSLAGKLGAADFEANTVKVEGLRAYLLQGIQTEIQDIRLNSPENGCPNILNISFLGTRGEVILHSLEQEGIYVSTGSACSSNKNSKGSHVLTAMGLGSKEIQGAIRFSLSPLNSMEEMDYTLDILKKVVTKFRRLGSFR